MLKLIKVVVCLLILGVVGCQCGHGELLDQIQDNLKNDIGPKYKAYLDADTLRAVDLKDNDWGLVIDTVDTIERVRKAEGARDE